MSTEVIVAIIAGLPAVVAAIGVILVNQKAKIIHLLVNSRLTEALAKIDALELKLFRQTGAIPTGEPPRKQ